MNRSKSQSESAGSEEAPSGVSRAAEALGKADPADRTRAMRTARQFGSEDRDDVRVEKLAADFVKLLTWQRTTFADAKERRSQHATLERSQMEREAEAFESAAAALPDQTFWIGAQLQMAIDIAPGSPEIQERLQRAVPTLTMGDDRFPMREALIALARDRRAIAAYCTGQLAQRGDPGDDDFVKLTGDVLRSHGVRPTASKKDGEARGNLVVACAMLRGATLKQSLRAFMLPTEAQVRTAARWESHLERSLCRMMDRLERLQRMRAGEFVQAPALVEVSMDRE